MSEQIIYKDRDIIIYNKRPGEDSEKITIDGFDARVLSRLDKPVCGLLPFSISKAGNKAEFSHSYRTVVSGKFDETSDTMTDLLYHDKRANKTYPVKRERNGVKKAELEYEVIAYNEELDISLVKITLKTGRTHQIRVQFASRKHPVVGDGKYGSRIKAENIALQAYELKYTNSVNKKAQVLNVPMPDEFPWNQFN